MPKHAGCAQNQDSVFAFHEILALMALMALWQIRKISQFGLVSMSFLFIFNDLGAFLSAILLYLAQYNLANMP